MSNKAKQSTGRRDFQRAWGNGYGRLSRLNTRTPVLLWLCERFHNKKVENRTVVQEPVPGRLATQPSSWSAPASSPHPLPRHGRALCTRNSSAVLLLPPGLRPKSIYLALTTPQTPSPAWLPAANPHPSPSPAAHLSPEVPSNQPEATPLASPPGNRPEDAPQRLPPGTPNAGDLSPASHVPFPCDSP